MEIYGYVGLAAAVIAAGVILWFISAINRFARMAVKIT